MSTHRIRFSDLNADVRRAAHNMGADAVIVMGEPTRVWRQNRRERRKQQRLTSPGRIRRLDARGGKFHYVNDRDHAEMWREMLRSDAGDLHIVRSNEWPSLFRKFSLITQAAGVPFPTRQERARENWGSWADAVAKEIEEATDSEINRYGPEAYDIVKRADCPICDLVDYNSAHP